MQTFAHIVVELFEDGWQAWFEDQPHAVCVGSDWVCAVAKLIDMYGSDQLDWKEIVEIEEMQWENHAEFLIPHFDQEQYPLVSSFN